MTIKLPLYAKEWGTPWEAFYRTETWEEVVTGWWGGWRVNYWMLFMSRMGLISQTNLDYTLNNWDQQYLYLWVVDWDYDNCLVDFVWYGSGSVEVERFDWIRLTSENDMYSFMLANFANDWTNYTNTIKAYIYDEVDSELPVINKINGMNAFFWTLVWKNNYKHGTNTHLEPNDNNYGYFQSWVQEAIRLMTPHTSYTYNAVDEPRRVIRRPANHRTLYWLINAGGVIDNNWWERHSINTSLNFVNVQWEYSVKHNDSYYSVLDLSTLNFQFRQKSEFKEVAKYIWDPNYSVIICYQIKNGNNYSIYIKPVGVDTMYLDFIDTNKYSLELLHHARNQFVRLNQSQILSNNLRSNSAMIEKKHWIYQGRGWLSKWGYRERPYTNFILRDKVTNKISLKSKATVKWRSGRDAPLYATVNY